MATSVVNPRAQFFANNGRPLIGGRIHTYVAGSSTRARTYKDAAKAQPNTNPIILDGRGEAQIYLAEGVEYKFVVEDSKGALIYTQEPVYGVIWPNAEQWPSDATLAYQYMSEAKAAVDSMGVTRAPFDTYAQALSARPGLEDGERIEISIDETQGGSRTRYKVEAGELVFLLNLDQLRSDLAKPSGKEPVGGFARADDLATYSGDATFAKVNAEGEFGWYVVDLSDTTSPADRGFVVVDAKNRRWKRVNADTVKPEMFGLTNTPAATAAAFNAAANYCRESGAKLIKGAKFYTLGADVNLRSVNCDFLGCNIIVEDGFLLIIGGDAGTTINPEQILGIIKRPRAWSFNPADYPNPTVKCIGAKGQTIRISHVDHIQFFQSTDPATYPSDASQAYSKFYIDFACTIGVDTDPRFNSGATADGAGSANQWFNENQFFLGRCIHFYYRGSYPHNNNRVYGGCFETSNSHIEVAIGNKNFFYDVRFEGAPKVTFGENTLGNVVEFTWFSSTAQVYEDTLPVGAVIDNGALNIVKDARLSSTASDRVLTVSVQDTIFNGQPGNYNARQATRRAIRSVNRSAAQLLADTDFIEVSKGDYLFFGLKSLQGLESRYVAQIRSYDKNFNLIAGNAANFESSAFATVFADAVQGTFSSNAKHQRAGILSADIKYIRIDILSYGNASFDNALEIFCNHVSRTPGRSRKSMVQNTKRGYFGICTTAPTKFLGRIGDIAAGTTADYRCTYALETTLADAAAASATQLRLTSFSLSGFGSVQIGDLIGIDLDDGNTHWTTVSAIGGGLHTITAALPSGASAGSAVYVSRLATR